MIPSTGIRAILFGESLSSTSVSCNFGPAARPGEAAPRRSNWTKCSGLKNRLMANRHPRTNAAVFQPVPLRGGAATRRGGGITKGGGPDEGGGSDGGRLSIAPKRYLNRVRWASGQTLRGEG